jgi:hypothetical protein
MNSLDWQTSPLVSRKNDLYFGIVFIKYEIKGEGASHWIRGEKGSDSNLTNVKSGKRDLFVFSR